MSLIDRVSSELTQAYIAAVAKLEDPKIRTCRQGTNEVALKSFRTGFCILRDPTDPTFGFRRIKQEDLPTLSDDTIPLDRKQALICKIADEMAKAPSVLMVPIFLPKDQALLVQQYWVRGFAIPSFTSLGLTDMWTSLDENPMPGEPSNETIRLCCTFRFTGKYSVKIGQLLAETVDSRQLMAHFREMTKDITLDMHSITTDEALLLKLYVSNINDDLSFKSLTPEGDGNVTIALQAYDPALQLEIQRRCKKPEFVALAEELSKELPQGYWISTFVKGLQKQPETKQKSTPIILPDPIL